MAREKKHIFKLSESNEHLLDVFSDNLYLELGTIEYEPLNNLLSKKLVDFKDLSYFDMIKKGLGSMTCSSEELTHKLPFLYFNNLVSKNKSYTLVITYGLVLRRNGYKEFFTPIILIPVKMYFENDTILFQMISRPVINPYLKKSKNENIEDLVYTEKLDNILNIDKYILSFLKNHTDNIRLENYLTIINTKQPEIALHHEMFKLENTHGLKLIDNYSVTCENDIYNITQLDRVQRNAVAIASTGNSFVLTGYQGTGKTTTLTNIASDFIKNGKRVLYISNNDNTLQTVYNTFKECELSAYVSLFNQSFDKINEKNVDIKKAQIIDKLNKKIIRDKYQQVDEIANHFAAKIKNYYVIEMMNELVLTKKPDSDFSEKIMNNAYKLYRHEIKQIYNSLLKLEELMKKMPSFVNSHFINIPISHNITNAEEPLELFSTIYDNFCKLRDENLLLIKEFGFNDTENYNLFKSIIKDYFNLNKMIVPSSWYSYQTDQEDSKKRFFNYYRARELYEQIKEETSLSKQYESIINSKYDVANIEFDVKRALNDITDGHFEVTDNKINKVLKDYENIENELSKATAYCKDLENNYKKFRLLLKFDLNLEKTKIVEEVLECIFVLDKGYFSKSWFDYEKRLATYERVLFLEQTLDKYEDSMKVFNKYYDSINSIDIYIAKLIKKNKDEGRKYRGMLIDDLLNYLYFIKENYLNVSQMKKEYLELTDTNYEYNVHVSEVLKEFIEKHNVISDKETRIELEKSFQKLSSENIKPLLSWSKELRKAILNVNRSYDFFASYSLISDANNIVEKSNNIKSIIKYIKNLFKWQEKMRRLLKTKKDIILIDSYLELSDNQDRLSELNNKINNNNEYKFLYEKLFDGENTNIEALELLLNDFDLYINIFKKPDCLVKSFNAIYNNNVATHLDNAQFYIDQIDYLFKQYVKIFKTNINKFYYDDFDKIIDYFKTLLDSEEELRTYLAIADEMKVLLKYKLYNLNNYILYHNHELYADRFKYSYFNYLYKEYINNHPDFLNREEHERLLNDVLYEEADLIKDNAEVIKLSNKLFRTGKAKHLDYNSYILKNKNSRLLFLSDTIIANAFLNIDFFDLVIIDDAHMLHANAYHKVVNCKQVIISGNEQMQTSVGNNLISRMRPNNIIKLKYRYAKTPLKLLTQFKDLDGRFYAQSSMNHGISIYNDNYNHIIMEKIHNNPNCKINFFTTSLHKIHNIIQNVGNVLYDKDYSMNDIAYFFENNLNVCDLSVGNFIQADYNIIDLDSYYNINDNFTTVNYISNLLCCGKEVIILDSKGYLHNNELGTFVDKLKKLQNYDLPAPVLQERTIIEKISNSLLKYRIKTVGVFKPLHLVVEYDNKYYGILLLENPNNTEFTLLNEYREFKSNEFPIIVRWLTDLVYDYDEIIKGIAKEIRS